MNKTSVYEKNRKRKYKKIWEELEDFKGWLEECKTDGDSGYCRVCNIRLRAHKTDLKRHKYTPKHERNMLHPPKLNLNGLEVPRRPSVYKRKKALKHEYIPDNFNVMEGLPEDEYNDDDFIWHTDNDEDEFFVKAEESLEDDDLIMETLDMDENEQIPIAEESNETFEEINADKIDSDSTSPPKKNIKIEENSPPAPHIKILKSERISKVQNSENNINNKNKLGLKFKPKSTCDPLQKSTQAVNEDFENLEGVNDNILLSFKEEKLKECQQNEFIPLEKENFSMEEEHLDESLSIVKPTSAELFGLSIAKDIEGIPSRIFRKIKLRIMHVINEELLKYEMEKEDAV